MYSAQWMDVLHRGFTLPLRDDKVPNEIWTELISKAQLGGFLGFKSLLTVVVMVKVCLHYRKAELLDLRIFPF